LRIGIDATSLPAQLTGAGNYVFQLLSALARGDRANEYLVFTTSCQAEALGVEREGFRVVRRDFPGRGMRLAWEQLALPALVHRYRLDVLHSPHYTMPLRHSARSVVTFHDLTFVLYPELHQLAKRLFFPAMMRWTARHAQRIIAVSESTRVDLVRTLGVSPERVTTVLSAADADYRPTAPARVAEVCARYGIRAGEYLLYVGVLEPRKCIDQLVEAFGRIAPAANGLQLVIAGKRGWMYDQIFAQVAALGLEERVRFPGYVPRADLPGLYSGARAFVYPSRYEGFGLPVLEAMSCGTPVVTTNVSSLPEVAGDGALLVDPGDVTGLTAALARVVHDASLRRELSCRGQIRAANFSWERCAKDTVRVYEAAMAEAENGR
jgi:glycosyltransferase involved in cell wall biosynthesis